MSPPAAAVRISDRQPRRVERHLGLYGVDVAGENGAVGAVLHFDPLGRDVHRRIAVVALSAETGCSCRTCANAAVPRDGG